MALGRWQELLLLDRACRVKELAMTRLEANMQILKTLAMYAEKCPDQRFCQMLYNLNVLRQGEDEFYTESEDTLHAVKQALRCQRD